MPSPSPVQRTPSRGAESLERRALLSALFPNTNISRAAGNQAEGAIAVDPTNPARLFAASNQPGDGLFAAVSSDGGATWTGRPLAAGAGDGDGLPLACCDPTAAFDAFGNLYVGYAGDEEGIVDVLLSTDAGETFRPIARFEGDTDQPTVVAGPGGAAAPASVWVTFKSNRGVAAAGAAVTGRGAVAAFSEVQIAPRSRGNFGDIAIGPAGQVLVTYQKANKLNVHLDADGLGPAGFGRAAVASTTRVSSFDFVPAQPERGIDAEAALAYDRSGGPFNGRAYFLYTDESPNFSDNTDVLMRYSDDDGRTWSQPARLHDDTTLNSQLLPRMAVDQGTGEVGVAWYDCREDGGAGTPGDTNGEANDDARFYVTRVRSAPEGNGLLVSPGTFVADAPSNATVADSGVELGDYVGLDYVAGVLRPLWADNSNSTNDNPDGRLNAFDQYTAAVPASLLPSPNLLAFGGTGGGLRPALGRVRDVTAASRSLTVPVTFAHPLGIDRAGIDPGDLLVTGPNGFSAAASEVRSARTGRDGVVTVLYRLNAPQERFGNAENGVYTISLRPDEIRDGGGAAAASPGGVLGTFVVRVRARRR